MIVTSWWKLQISSSDKSRRGVFTEWCTERTYHHIHVYIQTLRWLGGACSGSCHLNVLQVYCASCVCTYVHVCTKVSILFLILLLYVANIQLTIIWDHNCIWDSSCGTNTHSTVCPCTHYVTNNDMHFTPTQLGRSALMRATEKGCSHTVEVLVQGGADLNIQDEVSWSSIPTTVVYITISTAVCLTVLHCMLNLMSHHHAQYDGLTGLMLATLEGWSETVSVLLQCGADPNVQNKVYLSYLCMSGCASTSDIYMYM